MDSLYSIIHLMYMDNTFSKNIDKMFIIFCKVINIKFNILNIFYLVNYFGVFFKFLYILFWITYLPRFTNATVVIILVYQSLTIVLLSFVFFYKSDILFEYFLLFDFSYIFNIFGISFYLNSFSYLFVFILFFIWAIRGFWVMYMWYIVFFLK